MRKFIFLLLMIVCLFYYCSSSDYTKEMFGGYYYLNEGPEYKSIINHYRGKHAIWADVTDYSYDKNCILVKQHPILKTHIAMLAFEIRQEDIRFKNNTLEDIKKSEEVADSIIKTDTFYREIFEKTDNFWIIDIKQDKLYGPFSQSEYLQMRKTLGIGDNLKLKFEK